MNASISPRPQRRHLRIAFMLMAAALAAALGFAAYARGFGHHSADAGGMGMGWMNGHMLERMLDDISATPEQRSQVRGITEAALADLRAQREARVAMHEQTMQLFTQPTVDANAVEVQRQKHLQQFDQTSKRLTQAMLEISRVLTPEQRSQLAERMKKRGEMMERHMQERRQMDGSSRGG